MGLNGANLEVYQAPSGEFYTNHQHLPAEVVAAIMKDRYTDITEDDWDYSASTLTTPIQLLMLKKRYGSKKLSKHKLRIFDVTDNFWSFFGSVAHQVLEDAWHESMGSIPEERIYMTVHGKIVSGKLDLYHQPEIRDYKTTKVYKIMKRLYKDWTRAQNIYAALCRKNDRPVERINIVAMINNWAKSELYKDNYPPAPIQIIPLEVWPQEKAMQYIEDRVASLIVAEGIEDSVRKRSGDLEEDAISRIADIELYQQFPCTQEDMWQNFKDFALMKPGADRAAKCFDNREDALKHRTEKGWELSHEVKERWGKRTRCEDWCECAPICRQNMILNDEDPDAPAPIF